MRTCTICHRVNFPSLFHASADPYHDCERTQKNAQNCTAEVMTICPTMLARTFFDTKLAVGLFGCIRGYGSVRPTAVAGVNSTSFKCYATDLLVTAIGIMMNRSMYKNLFMLINGQVLGMQDCATLTWKSPKDDAKEYSKVMVVNWMREYNALILTISLLLP